MQQFLQYYTNTYQRKYSSILLTRLPNIWLIAALSFKVHSATTFALISFMYSMNAFKGFFIWGFFLSVKHHRRVWEVASTVWKSTVNWSQKPRSVKRALTLIVLLPCVLCFRVIRRQRRGILLFYRRPINRIPENYVTIDLYRHDSTMKISCIVDTLDTCIFNFLRHHCVTFIVL